MKTPEWFKVLLAVGVAVLLIVILRQRPNPEATAANEPPRAAPTLAASVPPRVAPAAAPKPAPAPTKLKTVPPLPPPPAPVAAGDEIGIFVTSNGLGEVIDCGCKQKPLGGLARRALWLKERAGHYKATLVVDSGGLLVADPGVVIEPEQELLSRTRAIFRSMASMNYAAVNVGPHEVAIGLAHLRRLAAEHEAPLVSTNILDASTGKTAFPSSLIREIGGLKVGIIGLTTATPPAANKLFGKQGLKLAAPVAAARSEVTRLRQQGCQMIIALSELKRGEMDDLGERVPEVDLVIGSKEMELTMRPEFLGRGFYVDPYNKGKWVGELMARPGKDVSRWVVSDLREKLEIEQVQLEREISYYQRQFAEEDAPGAVKKLDERARKFAEERYAGARARLQRVRLEMGGEIDPGPESSTLQLKMVPMNADELAEAPTVVSIVDEHIKVYPPPKHR